MATTSSRLRGRESLFAMTHRINRAHRQFKKAVQHGRARDHDYRWFLQARSLSLQGWGLIDLPLRASNEGSPRPRVARAHKIIRLHSLLCSASKKGTWPDCPALRE